jgi:hypothetical protein
MRKPLKFTHSNASLVQIYEVEICEVEIYEVKNCTDVAFAQICVGVVYYITCLVNSAWSRNWAAVEGEPGRSVD